MNKWILFLSSTLLIFSISCISKKEYISKLEVLCNDFDSIKNLSTREFQTGISDGKNNIIVTSGKVIYSKEDRIIQKIEENSFADYHYETNIYYKNEKPVKALIRIRSNPDSSIDNLDYTTVYYYKNKRCLQIINEKTEFTNCDETRKSADLLRVSYPIIE